MSKHKNKKVNQFFKDRENLTSEDRFLPQCYLMHNIDQLIKERKIFKNYNDNFLCITGDPSAFLGRIKRNSQEELFLEHILPYELSSLVPEVRLYKVNYDPKNNQKYQQKEFFFDNHLSTSDVNSILQKNSLRSTGVGLKSLNWEFIGSNPAESKRLIKVDLKIFFASMQDLTKKSINGLTFLDLLKPTVRSVGGYIDSKHHQVKLTVGWSLPNSEHLLFRDKPGLKNAINNTRLSMFLSLVKHDLDFEQDGRVTLSAQFYGRLETRMGNAGETKFDVLETLEEEKRLLLHKNNYKLTLKEIEARKKLLNCVTIQSKKNGTNLNLKRIKQQQSKILKDEKNNEERRKEFIIDEKKLRYEKLMNLLIKGNKVFFKALKKDELVKNKGFNLSIVPECTDTNYESLHKKAINQQKSYAQVKKTPKGKLTNKNLFSRIPNNDDCVLVHYFYFGDLIDIILEQFYSNKKNKNKEYFTRFLLGTVANPMNPKQKICISDIPISLKLFGIWFYNQVIKFDRETYSFNDFIRDILNGLVMPILNDKCLRINSQTNQKTRSNLQRTTPRIVQFQINGTGKGGKVEKIIKKALTYKQHAEQQRKQNNNAIDVNTFNINSITTVKINSKVSKQNLNNQESLNPPFDYFFIFSTEEEADYQQADYIRDIENGIYHFHVGSDRGIIKKIKFEQNNLPFYKEAIMQGTGLEWLKRLYDAKIHMFGNASFIPGQKIYINPEPIGLGKPENKQSIASELGLGGYYIIIKVEGSIESGKFETIITCKWESKGDKTGVKTTGETIDNCISEYKKTVGKGGLQIDDLKKFFTSIENQTVPQKSTITQFQNNSFVPTLGGL